MAECYPQGCPPCTEEISFPENPINGQRECFLIGKDPNTNEDILKCWVYDQCVPGWRAEGPATAPINFKGQVDLTKTEAENGITVKEAGDYYIVAVGSATQQFLNNEWANLQHEVNKGAFILWTGTEWVEIPRPCGEEADCALDVTPNPDNREAGVVVIASVEEVEARTDKCKAVTPYTLGEIVPEFSTVDSVTVNVGADARSVCITDPNLSITATAKAKDADGDSIFASYTYQWKERSGNTVTPLNLVRAETVSGATAANLIIEDFEITPVTGSRTFFVTVIATDLFNNTVTADSGDVVVTMSNALEITAEPTSIDLSTATTDTITVGVGNVSADLPAPAQTINWFFNGVKITGATTPDLGYTFTNFTTDTLGIERTDATAGSYPIYSQIIGGCNATLTTTFVTVKGPGGIKEDTGESPPAFPAVGAVGSYTIFANGTPILPVYSNQGGGNTLDTKESYYNPFKIKNNNAIYQVAGVVKGGNDELDDPRPGTNLFLCLRIE